MILTDLFQNIDEILTLIVAAICVSAFAIGLHQHGLLFKAIGLFTVITGFVVVVSSAMSVIAQ